MSDMVELGRRAVALVREAWGDPTVSVQAVTPDGAVSWRVFRQWPQHVHMLVGDTEAAALVAALEAAT